MLTPTRVKNSNLDSYKTVIHLCAEVPQDIHRRAKAETYSALTQWREINLPASQMAK